MPIVATYTGNPSDYTFSLCCKEARIFPINRHSGMLPYPFTAPATTPSMMYFWQNR